MNIKTTLLMLVAYLTLTMQTAFGQGIIPSNWRNEQTGDWVIGFYDDFAIYDCKFWNYKEKTQQGDQHTFVLEADGKEVTVVANTAKNGKRDITINGNKATYSIITGKTLPDYPAKDTRTGFKDSHYNIDTVTLVGWLKDMPKKAKRKGNEFSVGYEDILLDDQASAYGKMDALGRFVVKIPLLNVSEVFMDWGRCYVHTFLEPGETYFFLYDFKEQRQLFMGDNCRVQNELLSYPMAWLHARLDGDNKDQDAALKSFEKTKQEKADKLSDLDKRVAEHPTLSQRYIDYLTENYNVCAVRNLMQGRFYVKDRNLPKEIMDYAGQNWKSIKPPYTLCRDFETFQRDFIGQLVMNRYWIKDSFLGGYTVMVEEIQPQILRLCRDKGKVKITDDELQFMDDYAAYHRYTSEKGRNAVDEATRDKWDNLDTYKKIQAILDREDISPVICSPMVDLFMVLNILDSVGCDKDLRDIIITNRLYKSIDRDRQPLNKETMEYFEENVSLPAAKDFLREQQAKYVALVNKDIDNNPSLKTSAGLENMSDGEQLLRKITEPYRGRLILLDVWGTWCAPCKRLLSQSKEEYERLKDYDLVYLYLCNRSSDKSWKNVIKQYDLVGDDIVHYNLPPDMQDVIEHFLGVNGYPTYKLIDRDGSVLKFDIDVFDLESVAKLLEKVK